MRPSAYIFLFLLYTRVKKSWFDDSVHRTPGMIALRLNLVKLKITITFDILKQNDWFDFIFKEKFDHLNFIVESDLVPQQKNGNYVCRES